MSDDIARAVAGVGPRLRKLRSRRGWSLFELSALTGISTSTLCRLESGQRRASLELLLPIVRTYRVTLDDLVSGGPLLEALPTRAA